jgi:hypothetical protein
MCIFAFYKQLVAIKLGIDYSVVGLPALLTLLATTTTTRDKERNELDRYNLPFYLKYVWWRRVTENENKNKNVSMNWCWGYPWKEDMCPANDTSGVIGTLQMHGITWVRREWSVGDFAGYLVCWSSSKWRYAGWSPS